MATATMQFNSQGDDGSFIRLFRYFSGENVNEQKVAMTIPVFIEFETQDDQGQIRFVITKNVAEKQFPEPSDDNVQIRRCSSERFVVVPFSGKTNSERQPN